MSFIRSKRGILWTILIVSCVLKIMVILFNGHTYNLDSDDMSYLRTARIWLDTGEFTYNDPERPTVFITPAFPAFIAVLMKFIGEGYVLEQTIRIIQTLIMTFCLYMLYVIGKRIWNERVGLWAAGISAFYLPLWLVSNFILTEALFVLSLMLLVYCALRAKEQPTIGWAVAFGLAWVFATYVRPTIALWPGIFLLLLLVWRQIPWRKVMMCGVVAAIVFVGCLAPWWVRNYEVSGGQFIPLTKSSGNPLLLGTFPYGLPSLEEQRTWHKTNNLWENDEFDTKWAKERIRTGFIESPKVFISWYTIGKFSMFWGDVYYWRSIPGMPLTVPIVMHYVILISGVIGIWLSRRNQSGVMLVTLLAYFTILHMIYLAHSRYSVVLIPILALFSAVAITQMINKFKRIKDQTSI
ncbi:glycosyltransferase family 39 protein [Paenibacillus albiflavus]|uniref:Glycosyltransferase family 39 protein n=1 Tax=Paenibacillus albiflavus TaxID=2545760 RepID=A0A4R4E252_9BACL|nr:glycosyltransferase family 39 protein [Paenibacillus albiflavus]TCZ73584.1 glycosyltransferase family 39 protein [Paenibacillus albiflavus]